MKRKNILIGLGLILSGLTACEENKIDTYSAEDGIYFNKREQDGNILTDSSNLTFVYIEENQLESTVTIPVQLIGRTADVPRELNIKVTGGTAVQGEDYVLPTNPVLPAGASTLDYIVTLKRSEILKTEAKTIELAIEENVHFRPVITHEITDIQNGTDVTAMRHKIEFSELFVAPPAAWPSYSTFTPERFFLMCRVMDVPRADFNDPQKITSARFNYLNSEMVKYVAEQLKSENPDPEIFDKDGNPIF